MNHNALIDAVKSALSAPGAGESLRISLTNSSGTLDLCMGNYKSENPTEEISNKPPRIGDYWSGQGGYYAGIMRDGSRQWHLILAVDAVDVTALGDQCKKIIPSVEIEIKGEWGKSNSQIPGEFSRRDGKNNTRLILAADPENKIASHISSLLIGGHKDYYWPSECENNLLFANLPEHLKPEWHWSSTQFSANRAWNQGFEDGHQDVDSKGCRYAARAVRRILIIE
ncbi:DUF1566 domain-containing protein [Cellvibrio sp. KY-GH-1]|uniref:DUF1566 domain-containing protein n=1 Tax=Cellvibrio sp. KY-GH-1 TaxID=2303332 RepID=UPI0012461825|nr:DUF1566 domain-containing protein [Cellvibrio sp. KY-GH-1]QEY15493.1 DUF1566 domain-containing protein [Cellvibrio sp. KY-GH-1]